MEFSFDGDPRIDLVECGDCGREHESAVGFVLADGDAYAVYYAAAYPHADEAWVDVTLGSWEEPDYSDHVTFGCRIGLIEGHEGAQCSLVPAGQQRSESAMFGRKLTRDEALAHPRVREFWDCIDWLMLNDRLLHETVFHLE